MNKLEKMLLVIAATLFSATTFAATTFYWVDNAGKPVRDGSGKCINALNHGIDIPACRGEMVAQVQHAAPFDSDKDGVTDNMDQCPGTAAGLRVDARGCPMVMDADGDGVADNSDRCPGTPANITVDATGCPLDTDRDGVADYLDQCANTPLGSTVDTKGCPQRIVVRDLNFASGSAALTAESRAILDGVVAGIKANPALKEITVTGYTDSQGGAAANKALSERRAKSVANYLGEQGLSGLTINAVGMGEENPIASNDTAEGRAENRRVEIDLK